MGFNNCKPGLDFGILDGRMRFTGDIYTRKTTDMFAVGIDLPLLLEQHHPKVTMPTWLMDGKCDEYKLANKPSVMMSELPLLIIHQKLSNTPILKRNWVHTGMQG